MVNFENRQTWVFPLKTKRKRVLLSSTPNGSVTPVTGMSPITTLKFNKVWKDNINIIPKAKYFPNKSLQFKAIFTDSYIIMQKRADTTKTPKNPSSSLIIENIKSVWGSGR